MRHQYEEASNIIPHVLIFFLPIQGPINSMLQLAELFCLAGLKITFLNTIHNQQRLLRCTDVQSRFEKYDELFQFVTIHDELPEEHPRSIEQFGDIIRSVQTVAEPFIREILLSRHITCVIPDALCYYVVDIGNDMGVQVIPFDTISPSCLWVYLCLPKLIQAQQLPFKGTFLGLILQHILLAVAQLGFSINLNMQTHELVERVSHLLYTYIIDI